MFLPRSLCRHSEQREESPHFAFAFALAVLLAPLHASAQARMVDTTPPVGITAITGGKLLTITHGTIENGVILLESGKIAAIGTAATIKVPKGATIVDARGMTVYPGLIAAETTLGLSEVESDEVNNDLVETSEEIFPQMHVYDAFHAETERIPIARFNGITNAVVAPAGEDTMPGQDIFIQLAGRDRDAMILARDNTLSMNFGNDPKRRGKYPSTRMGEISQLHQALIDAAEYMHKKEAAAAAKPEPEKAPLDPKGDKADKDHQHEPPKFSLRDEALIPYLKGEKPVVIGVDEGHDIEAVMALANEFHLKVILDHVTRSQGVLDKVASYHVPVMIGSIYDLPRANERFDSVYTLPAELAKRGVKIVLIPGDAGGPGGGQALRNLPYVAGMAVAYGLPYDEAMKSITLNPAEVFGMAGTLGSLDVGKTANIVIANGDPLDVRTSVKQVYIDGVAVPMETRQTRLRDEYMPKK
jgi:imidazolonepropionase-like amidohydrolase